MLQNLRQPKQDDSDFPNLNEPNPLATASGMKAFSGLGALPIPKFLQKQSLNQQSHDDSFETTFNSVFPQ